MKRKALLTLVAVALLALAIPGWSWADTPFGVFGGSPSGDNAASGLFPVQGWALAQSGVNAVDIVVDGGIFARAHYGRHRPRVAVLFPGFPDSNAAGFAYQIDTTHFLNGLHTVSARVQSNAGAVVYLNSFTVEFSNVTANLVPFGAIQFPNHQAELSGNCDLNDRRRLFSVVRGYALDPGVQDADTGVGYVELMIDRSLVFNDKRDCHFSRRQGGLSDCYGLPSFDIEQQFPSLKDSPHAEFRFVLDVGALIGTTDSLGEPLYTPGAHVITIRAGDQFTQVTNLAEIAVTFTCRDFTQNDPSIGHIDNPTIGLLYSGLVIVSGWAVDFEGVATVEVLVDGTVLGFANLGLPRPDITADYPSYPAFPGPGWDFALDSTKLSNGVHELSVVVLDSTGSNTIIGKFPITVANVIP
ncbi:MAG TPA: hypothetical protein VHR45_13290 [Thermoanaerobaculia bacterium]|nr:hypothetical protein [Thermoanaerobaculia bacterium]